MKDKKHPDFNEWLKTPDGVSSNDINTLAEQKYLTNRLFWAFDAGRNCVWDQYTDHKRKAEELKTALSRVLQSWENSFEEKYEPFHAAKALIESLNTK